MKNAYKIIVNNAQGSAKTLTHDVPAPGSFWGPLKIKANPGARYQLVDVNTGQGPDNIRVKRVGKDLRISFEGRDNVDVMITDYYEHAGNESLVGEVEAGVLHAYVPESGDSTQMLSRLTDGAKSTGMALGNEQLAASGAAVGALVAAAGFNPLLAAPLALLGAGGGGGAGAASATPKPNTTATIDIVAITDDSGVSGSDFITNDKSLTYSGTVSNFTANGDKVKVELLDATGTTVLETAYVDVTGASGTTAGAGAWTWTRTTDHADGQYTLRATIVDTAGNRTNATAPTNGTGGGQDTQVVIVDTSSTDNYNPEKNPSKENDPNKGLPVQIVSIDADTGVSATDFVTSDNTLTFKGTVADTFVKNGDFVELQLLDLEGKVVASQYVEPVNNGGQWRWEWDNSKQALADGTYKLTAQLVDKAGNAVGAPNITKDITIDTNPTPDPNSKFSIAVTGLVQDSGVSAFDFLTNQRNLSFKGNIGPTNTDFTGKVLVQVVGTTDGKVISQDYVTPAQDGTWLYDNTKQNLGFSDKNTQYLLNASVVDLAGNILKSTDQSFTVDLKKPIFRIQGLELSSGNAALIFENMTLVAEEAGTFSYSSQVPLGQPSSTMFGAGTFSINFTDIAGNISTLSNVVPWEFKLAAPIVETKPTTTLPPSTFGSGELAGSIGTFILGPHEMALDLSTLHTTSPGLKSIAAVNHIVMTDSAANDTLELTTSDVLALGVKNSFVSNGRQQIRIDGDTGDKVILDDLLGGSTYAWSKADNFISINASKYDVYTNTDLGIDLFIQQVIATQLI